MADVVRSIRLETDIDGILRARADSRGETLSDLIRLGIEWVLNASDAELDRMMMCPVCRGTGKRIKGFSHPIEDHAEAPVKWTSIDGEIHGTWPLSDHHDPGKDD